ncbi:Uncharacterized protein BP5553_06966 [Venustampulla echinocandica]|uniref:E3 SUMO-protein ligase pli1 n=1 Tax=Venustampulla echinocandica TaxID=2656787 RepID=A0A370TI62_9HELO|nr:Uncharacterized protein BP5553_06966 [Venustampulla echinocandica]RDL35035.1 Uncharacterized protein BP5553_06966 [Venustampulla echinocandica]
MASMGGGYLDPEPLIRTIRDGGLLNKTLQSICHAEGQSKNGVKSELQARIIERIRQYAAANDVARFENLKNTIYNPTTVSANGSPYRGMAASSSSPARGTPTIATPATYFNTPGSHTNGYNMGGGANLYRGHGHQKELRFKPSPFFRFEQQLGATTACDTMQHHRHTVKITLKVQDYPVLSKVLKDPALRVMVFCASEEKGLQDTAFPHQSEIKVNGGEVKANLRGLKNKPGSTRPVDITKELRLNLPAYGNSVEMTYALTSKAGGGSRKFYLAIHVVRIIPVPDLVESLKNGKKIKEEAVLDDMRSKANDADIVTTASVLSLKCPLSTLRIDLPCRSIACRHNQCFDATSYLQLQEQGPTWLCPICNNSAPFDSLAVDEYVRTILKNTSKSVDQVTIQPDGKWELHSRKEPLSHSNGVASDDDDDLVEVTKTGDSVSMGTPLTYRPLTGALPQRSGSSRDSSSASAKRPIAAVIDLTSSGDEDEEPVARTPKRQQTSGNGYGAPSTIPAFRPAPAPSNPNSYAQPRS